MVIPTRVKHVSSHEEIDFRGMLQIGPEINERARLGNRELLIGVVREGLSGACRVQGKR